MSEIEEVLAGERRWALVQGDCREVLLTIPAGVVDHVLTDPPYSRDLYLKFRSNSQARKTVVSPTGKKLATSAYLALANQQIGAMDDVLPVCGPEFLRIAGRWIVVFHDAESGHLWKEAFGRAYVRAGVWIKPNPVPQLSGDRPGQGFESMTIAHRPGRKHWNGGGMPAVWCHMSINGNWPERADAAGHPCPKPLALMLDLVAQFTDPGDLVLDPFAGSGTTGVACLRLGRRFIGIEKDAGYAATATDRLRAEERGQDLRSYRSGQEVLFDIPKAKRAAR